MPNWKHIRWADLPVERRRRLVVMMGELIQRQISPVREADHEGGMSRADAS